MLKAIILDDEHKSRTTLLNMLNNYCEGIEVVGEGDSVQAGVKLIQEKNPDLVFLDIEMPQENGFRLFSYFKNIPFEVIFTTAYNQYAVQAFRFSAVDYLLKPINLEELRDAVKKVINKRDAEMEKQKLQLLRENFNNVFKKIAFQTPTGFEIVELDEIVYCEADGNYSKILLKDDSYILAAKTLRDYESLLDDFNFFRVHRSFLINMNQIKGYSKVQNPTVTMVNGKQLPISRAKRQEFYDRIMHI